MKIVGGVIWWLIAGSLVVVPCASGERDKTLRKDPGRQDGAGEALIGAYCGACHSLMMVKASHLSSIEWDQTIGKMENEGLGSIPEGIRVKVLDYLRRTQGPVQEEVEDQETPWAWPRYRANPLW